MTHSSTTTSSKRKRDFAESLHVIPPIIRRRLHTDENPISPDTRLGDRITNTTAKRDELLARIEESQNEKEKHLLREEILDVCLELQKLQSEVAENSSKWRPAAVRALLGIERIIPVSNLLRDFSVTIENMNQEFQDSVRRVHDTLSMMLECQTENNSKAQRNHFIHFLLVAAVSSLPLRGQLPRVYCETILSGAFDQDPIHFLLHNRRPVVILVQVQEEDFALGEADVLMRLYEAGLKQSNSSIKHIFGIVSSAEVWRPYAFNIKDRSFFCGVDISTDIPLLAEWNQKQTLPGIDTVIHMVHEMIRMWSDESLNFS